MSNLGRDMQSPMMHGTSNPVKIGLYIMDACVYGGWLLLFTEMFVFASPMRYFAYGDLPNILLGVVIILILILFSGATSLSVPYILSALWPGNKAGAALNKLNDTIRGHSMGYVIVGVLSLVIAYFGKVFWSGVLDENGEFWPMFTVLTTGVSIALPAWYWARIMPPDWLARMMAAYYVKQVANDIDVQLSETKKSAALIHMRIAGRTAGHMARYAPETSKTLVDMMYGIADLVSGVSGGLLSQADVEEMVYGDVGKAGRIRELSSGLTKGVGAMGAVYDSEVDKK